MKLLSSLRPFADLKTLLKNFAQPCLRLFVLFIALSFTTKAFAQPATVSTNKSDYMPGEYVIITGTDWQPGETVKLVLTETPLLHPPETLYAVANSQGNIYNSEYHIEEHDRGQSFILVATGLSSGYTAETSFTDAASANLDQVRNGSAASPTSPGNWVNGNAGASQAHYSEGWSIPYRMIIGSLTAGTHELIIEWDTKDNNKHAIDYITSYNNLDNPPGSHAGFGHAAEIIDPTIGIAGLGAPSTFPIPAPGSAGTSVPGQPTTSFNALPAPLRLMTIYNGTITAISYVNQDPLSTASSKTSLKITFTTTTATTAVLAWGGHIATEADWGLGEGATGISGSPYHTRLISIDGGGGNQDRSLSAAAVVIPPRASVVGPIQACPETNSLVYTSTILNPNSSTVTYSWSLINNTAGAVISGSTTGSSINVVPSGADFIPGGSFNVQLIVTRNGISTTTYLNSNTSPGNNVVISNLQVTASATPPVFDLSLATTSQLNATVSGGTGPYTYLWSADAPGGSLSSHSIVNPVFTATLAGLYTYTVTVTDANGCQKTASVTIIVSAPGPLNCEVTGPALICPGTTNTYNGPSPIPPNFTYTWTLVNNTNGATISGPTNGTSVVVIAGATCNSSYTVHLHIESINGLIKTDCELTVSVTDTKAPVFDNVPANANADCSNIPAVGTPTATDDCSGATVTYKGEVRTDGTCAGNYTLTRTWEAVDGCGNKSTATQVISVTDTKAPEFSNVPANANADCSNIPAVGTPTATDDCSGATVTYKGEVRTDGNCPGNYTLTRTWEAVDGCGNKSTATQVITVTDTKAPVFDNVPANANADCSNIPAVGTPTATDDCSGATVTYKGEVRTDGNCPGNYTLTRTWEAVDGCGNKSTATQVITVTDTKAPVFDNVPANANADCSNIPAVGTPTATDDCSGATVTYKGEVRTDGNCAGNYTLTRTWEAVDGCGNKSTATQVITVTDTKAPVFDNVPANANADCSNIPAVGTPTATDDCSGATVTYKGEVRTDGNCAGNYTLTRTWEAVDGCGNKSTATQVITVTDTKAPVFDNVPANANADCSNIPAVGTPTATDDCSGATVTYKGEVRTDGNCAGNYTLTRTWEAVDGCGNKSTATQVITVTDTKAPVFDNVPANANADCSNIPAVGTPTATDDCSGATVTYKGEVRTDGNCAGNYTLTRTWEAVDGCGNKSTATQVITVTDTKAPTFSGVPANANADCSNIPAVGTPTATDDCSGATVSYKGEVRTDGTCAGNYTLTRTWEAVDGCGNKSTATQVITVTDTKAPVFDNVPANANADCSNIPAVGTPTATDDCSGATVSYKGEVRTDGTCAGNYTLTRTWEAVDGCGNKSTATQVITVTDTKAPTFSDVPANANADCSNIPAVGTPTATDDCSGATVTYKGEVRTDGNCAGNYTLTRTWEAEDGCGNKSTATQVITVTDTKAPVLVGTISNKTIDCEVPVVFATPTFTDCSPVTVTFVDAVTGFACPSPILKEHTRTWTATDECGYQTVVSQTIKVKCCPTVCTYTIGFYGNKNGKACTPAGTQVSSLAIMQGALTAAGGSKDFGIIDALNYRYFKLVNADLTGTSPNIFKMLPGGGTPVAIAPGSVFTSYGNISTWPRVPISTSGSTAGRINNTTLTQTMALFFNLYLDNTLGNFQLQATGIITSPKASCTSSLPLAQKDTFYIPQNVLNYLTSSGAATVTGLYNLANQYLGGFTVPGITIGDVTAALNAINLAFDKCRAFRDYYTPGTSAPITTSTFNSGKDIVSTEKLVLKAMAYPNPFNSFVEIRFTPPVDGKIMLEVFTLMGQRIYTDQKTIAPNVIGISDRFKITGQLPKAPMLYKLSIGGQTVTGKLFPIND